MDFLKHTGRAVSGWFRQGFGSGTVRGVVRAVTDLVYYFSFAYCFSWYFIRSTTMFGSIMTHEQKVPYDSAAETAVLAMILCGAVSLLLQRSIGLAVLEAVLLVCGYLGWKEGGERFYLYVMCALIVGATGRSFRMILGIAMTLGSVIMVCAFAASQAGIIEDLIYSQVRHSFGIVYCTDCAAHVLFLMLIFLMPRIERMRPWYYAPLVFGVFYMYFTHAKTDIMCALLLIAGTLLYHLSVRWKGRRIWRIPAAVLCFSFPVSAFLSISAALFVDTGDPGVCAVLDSIDKSLIKRLEMSRRAFEENPVNVFGTKISEHGFGGTTSGFTGWEDYFFIDNSYIRLLMFGGISLFILLLLILTWAQLRCFACGKYGCVFLLGIVALTCIMEHHLIEYYYNVFPLMAFSGAAFFRRQRTGSRQRADVGRQPGDPSNAGAAGAGRTDPGPAVLEKFDPGAAGEKRMDPGAAEAERPVLYGTEERRRRRTEP